MQRLEKKKRDTEEKPNGLWKSVAVCETKELSLRAMDSYKGGGKKEKRNRNRGAGPYVR